MDYKYDAFISYRHAEKDTLIASEVQKTLEHFQIPKALRKSSGKERFNRVFRDVEELPLANNLTEELEQALKDSQYLIVICSYSTSESDWVKREIDTFLEFHDYDKQLVLTVLVEGEPGEVIPEVLRHDNITHYLADGTFYCKDELVEPLSADYRQPIKKARKTELPRLAAAMLGCKYDEIIRRRKAYQRRRLLIETTIVSAIAVGILVYIGQLYVKLQESLYKAQVSQSVYLAAESQRLLEAGDRSGAIQLALAALENSDGSKRPHTDEAEFALSQALGSYVTAGGTSSVPLWRYETESHIESYDISNSGEYIAALDFRGVIHIWNTNDHKETIYNDETNYSVSDIRFDKDDNLIVCASSGICVIDVKTMKTKWEYNEGGITKRIFSYYKGKGYIVVSCADTLYMLNAADGQLIKSLKVKTQAASEDTSIKYEINDFWVNSDFSRVAIVGKLTKDLVGKYELISYDVKSGKATKLIENSGDFPYLAFDSSGNLLVLRHSGDDSAAEASSREDITYYAPILFEKYSASGNKTWSNELPSANRLIRTGIYSTDYMLSDGTKKNVAIAAFGNKVVFVDYSNGKILKSVELRDSIIGCSTPKDDAFKVVLRNGYLMNIKLFESTNEVYPTKLVKDDGIGIISCSGEKDEDLRYFVEDSSRLVITEYVAIFSDSSYVGIEGTESAGKLTYFDSNGDFMLVYRTETLDGGKVDVYLIGVDLKDRKVIWEKKLPSIRFFSSHAFSPDNKYVYLFQGSGDKEVSCYSMYKVDVKTGEFKEANKTFKLEDITINDIECKGGFIWVRKFDYSEQSLSLYSFDMSNDSYKEIRVDITNFKQLFLKKGIIVSNDGKTIYLNGQASLGEDYSDIRLIIDGKTGKNTFYKCEAYECVVISDNEKYVAESTNDNHINVYTKDGKKQCKIDKEQRKTAAMGFNNDLLYVYYDTDELCCYDLKGRKIAELSLGNDPQSITTSELEFAQGMLFVTSGNNSGNNTDVIDISTNKRLCSFNGLLCIHNTGKERSDLELVVSCYYTSYGPYIRCFQFKTPDILIKEAKKYLADNNIKMSDEFKQKYGIE